MTKTSKISSGVEEIDRYVNGVLSGDIPACKWVRLACQRQVDDLHKVKNKDYPYYFEPKAAEHFFTFCGQLKHYEGAIYGEPLLLEDWQKFVFGSIFGWLKKKEFRSEAFKQIPIRRFREGVLMVPKKNGKSILSGAVALYMMDWDKWAGAQCYILAKNQTHAKDLGYRAATIMVQNSKELISKYRINKSAANAGIYFEGNNSFYKPITSKPESEDGRNVHFCGPDETKDWTDFEIYEVMKNGTVNAPNSLFLSTTTAGSNRESLGFQQQGYVEKLLSGVYDDDTTFGIIYGVDEEDKKVDGWWMNPEIWKKANPNYDISVFSDALQAMTPGARQSISKRTAFETKHLNVWHSSSEAFIQSEVWDKCKKVKHVNIRNYKEELEKYAGKKAWGGFDKGSVSDFTSFELVLEPEDGIYPVLSFFWIPEDNIQDRNNSQIIHEWCKNGFIITTPGNITDDDYVEDDIKEICSFFDMQGIAFDRFKLDQMVQHFQAEGLEMIDYGQGYVSMSPAVDNLEKMVLNGEIDHGGNPVLSWMNSNVLIRKDPAGNRKFDKEKSADKIDGMVAVAMALHISIFTDEKEEVLDWDNFKMI